MRQWGDFQTPAGLVELVLDTVWPRHEWGRVLEPTCGIGNFLVGACTRNEGDVELKGFEIQPPHVAEAQARLNRIKCVADIKHESIFDVNLGDLSWASKGPLLVVGNPPWITNSELAVLDSANLPRKSNFKGLSGYAAQTGAANFDIAEYILLKIIRELGREVGTVALLCKRTVARNTLEYASEAGLRISNAAIYRIDANAWFGAAVDACLFVSDIGAQQPNYDAVAHDSLGHHTVTTRMHVVSGQLVEDSDGYASAAAIDGKCPIEWRQGIKHDIARVAELSRDADGVFRNGLGEVVDVEPEFLYPILKSSDVFHLRLPARRKAIVTQRTLKEDPSSFARSAPKLWRYLQSHREVFAKRKSIIYKKRPAFSMFGIGPYTFAVYKVAVSGMYTPVCFRTIGPEDDKPVVLDDTCYFLPFDAPHTAATVTSLLSSNVVSTFIRSVTASGAKRPITKKVLQRIDLAVIAETTSAQDLHADATREFQRLTGRELTIDEFAACLGSLRAEWAMRAATPLFA